MRNFALETYFSKWEFSARYHMTASDAQSMTVSELFEQRKDQSFRLHCFQFSRQ